LAAATALRLLDKSRIRTRITVGKKVRCSGGSADEVINTRTSDSENNLPEQKARLKEAASQPNVPCMRIKTRTSVIRAFDAQIMINCIMLLLSYHRIAYPPLHLT